jgi:hypothetical protein
MKGSAFSVVLCTLAYSDMAMSGPMKISLTGVWKNVPYQGRRILDQLVTTSLATNVPLGDWINRTDLQV